MSERQLKARIAAPNKCGGDVFLKLYSHALCMTRLLNTVYNSKDKNAKILSNIPHECQDGHLKLQELRVMAGEIFTTFPSIMQSTSVGR